MTATVSAAGDVGEADPLTDDPVLAPLAVAAVRQWRFDPARAAGQPVAAQVTVPVVFAPAATIGANAVPPKVISQSPPNYPWGLRLAGVGGQSLIAFTVTIEGRVVDPFVVRSTNPAFDEAAIAAVRSWKFRPGQQDGRPVNSRMQVPMHFSIEGEKMFRVQRPKAFPSEMPEALRFDVPPDIADLVLPQYPVEALERSQGGKATIGFLVGPDGRVIQTRIVKEAPMPELTDAARAAVESFRFTPATRNGQPSPALLSIELKFSASGSEGHAMVTDETLRVLRLLKKGDRLVKLADLDGAPEPIVRPSPLFPTNLKSDEHAEALIEFVIDRQGIARLPRVVSATHREAGAAAALAVSQWRYEPPRQAGRTVDALVRIPIQFNP